MARPPVLRDKTLGPAQRHLDQDQLRNPREASPDALPCASGLAGTSGNRTSGVRIAEQRGGEFHRRGAGLAEQRVMERRQPIVDRRARPNRPSPRPPACRRKRAARHWRLPRCSRWPPCAMKAERRDVLAGQHAEIGADRLAGAQRPRQVVGGVLDADDVRQLGQPRHGRDAHIDHGARPGCCR